MRLPDLINKQNEFRIMSLAVNKLNNKAKFTKGYYFLCWILLNNPSTTILPYWH